MRNQHALYCKRRGWETAGEYTDAGVSGAKEHRPALDRLLAECRKRLVDAVVVYRYDRFARSLRQLVNALEEFRALGIDFVSLHEGVDTSTPNGRLVFGIFASIAEFERDLIRDRVRSGLAAAKAKGKRLGQPRKVVDARRIARLRAQGCSVRAIASELRAQSDFDTTRFSCATSFLRSRPSSTRSKSAQLSAGLLASIRSPNLFDLPANVPWSRKCSKASLRTP